MEDLSLLGKEEMDALTETGGKAKGVEVVEEAALEETEVEATVEERRAGRAGIKSRCVLF